MEGSEGADRLPGLAADQDRRHFAIRIKPNAFINLVPDHVVIHRMSRWPRTVPSPSATGSTSVGGGLLVPSEHHIGSVHQWISERVGPSIDAARATQL